MRYANFYRQSLEILEEYGTDNATLSVNELFYYAFGMRQHDLIVSGEKMVPPEDVSKFAKLVARRLSGEPLQYIIGNWDFYGLTLKVGEGVLIPRQDTEVLVDEVLAAIKDEYEPVVIDLCSGSGAIALAVAVNCQTAKVTAVEYSAKAAAYLKENSQKLAAENVTLLVADIFGDISLPQADVIVSNPPYLTAEELKKIPTEVAHEPADALYGGEDGLSFYRHIAQNYKNKIKPGGWLMFEVGYLQAGAVEEIMKRAGFINVESRKDTGGNFRVVKGQKQP